MDRGLVAVGVPVRDASGRVVAAVSASGPDSRLDPVLEEASALVVRAGQDLSVALGGLRRARAPIDEQQTALEEEDVMTRPDTPVHHRRGSPAGTRSRGCPAAAATMRGSGGLDG